MKKSLGSSPGKLVYRNVAENRYCLDAKAAEREYQRIRSNPLYQRKPNHAELKDIRRWFDPLRNSFHRSEMYTSFPSDIPQKRKTFRALVEASPLLWWDESTFSQALSPFLPLTGIESDEEPSFFRRLLTERVLYQEISRKALRLADKALDNLLEPQNLPLWTWVAAVMGVDVFEDSWLRYKLSKIERASHSYKPLAWMFAPPELSRRTGTEVTQEQLNELYDWNKKSRPIFRGVWKAFFWTGRGSFEREKTPKKKYRLTNNKSSARSKAVARWFEKFNEDIKQHSDPQRAYTRTLNAFNKHCRIKDPSQKKHVYNKLCEKMSAVVPQYDGAKR